MQTDTYNSETSHTPCEKVEECSNNKNDDEIQNELSRKDSDCESSNSGIMFHKIKYSLKLTKMYLIHYF